MVPGGGSPFGCGQAGAVGHAAQAFQPDRGAPVDVSVEVELVAKSGCQSVSV